MSKAPARIALVMVLALLAPSGAAGQTLQDIPTPPTGPAGVARLPLDPERRATLEQALKTRDYAAAEKLLAAEIEQKPNSPELLKFLASIFFLDGKYLNTAVALKKAEALTPLDDSSRFTLALATLRQATTLNPNYAEPYYELGRIYKRRGEMRNAEAAWATFHKLERETRKVRPH